MIAELVIAVAVLGAPPAGALPLANVKVSDADTITADCILGFDVVLVKQKIRASDFDAYESSRTRKTVGEITDEELAIGRAAKAELIKMVAEAKGVYVVPLKKLDPHGRRLGRIYVDDKSLASWASERGYVRPKQPTKP